MARSLLKSTAIYGSGAILVKSLGLFLIPVYTRYLSVEEYGALAILNLILMLTTVIFLLGISTACMRHYLEPDATREYQRDLYGTGLSLVLFGPLLAALFTTPVLYILAVRYLPDIPFFPFIFMIVLTGMCTPPFGLVTGLFRVQEKPGLFVIFHTIFFVIQGIAIVIALIPLEMGLKGQLAGQLFANGIFFVVSMTYLLRLVGLRFNRPMALDLLRFGCPLVPFFIFSWIGESSGRFFLQELGGLAEVGLFALAVQFAGIVAIIGNSVKNAAVPYFYKMAGIQDPGRSISHFVTKYFSAFGIVVIIIVVIAEPLIHFLVDERFYGAIRYVPLLLVNAWLVAMIKPFTWSLTFSKKTMMMSHIRMFSAMAVIGLLFLFVVYMDLGTFGVISAMIMTNSLILGLSYVLANRYMAMPLEYERLLPIGVVAGAVVMLVMSQADSTRMLSDLFMAIVAVVALLTVLFIGRLKPVLSRPL